MSTLFRLKIKPVHVISAFVILIWYISGRLINILDLPIFTDEAIYVRWAQIGSYDASWRYISLTDGKQPLYVWAVMVTVRLFSDPLLAGRIVSVFAGLGSMIGIGFLGRELFKNTRIGILSSLLYLTSPYALMYDRLALMDSTVTMFSLWSLFFAIRLVRNLRLDTALILGMSLGGGVLTKTNGFLSIYLLPFVTLVGAFPRKKRMTRVLKFVALASVAVALSQIYYSILRLSPWFHMIGQKDGTFIELPAIQLSHLFSDPSFFFSTGYEWFDYRTRFFVGNISALHEWTRDYMTLPIYSMVLFSIVLVKKFWREKMLILVWSVAPMILLAFSALVLYPRFIFYMATILLVLAAWSIDWIIVRFKLKSYTRIGFIALLLIYPLFVQGKILFSVLTAPIPNADKNQYISDIYSGWGIREVNAEIARRSELEPIHVITDGTFGLLPYGIEIYHVDNPRVSIVGIWPAPEEYTPEMKELIRTRPTYYIANQLQKLPEAWNAELLYEWNKGLRDDLSMRMFVLKEADENR